MYGLRRIIQVDGFIPKIRTVVDLDGHSIINGTNGAGKSSTLKLLSFFYGSDPSQLDSHAAGRDPFVQFYLPRQTSLLIFEYARESGFCCAVAYRHISQPKHVYRFLEGGFTEDRFSRIGDSGQPVYCKGHELRLHWQQMGLTCSQQIEVVTDYRAIIQNDSALINRLADSKSLRRLAASYCLGSRKTHMRYIDRICAAIISRSGNMERMKDMLADIMVEDGVIFPESPLHRADAGLAKEIASLREFEKEIPHMKGVLARHYERLSNETRLSSYGGQVRQVEHDLNSEIDISNRAIEELRERIKQLQIEWELDFAKCNRQVIEARNEVDACAGRIERLDEQYDAYEEQGMDKKASDLANLGMLMGNSDQAQARYQKLNEQVKEEENALNRSLTAELERFDRAKSAIQEKLDTENNYLRTKAEEYSSKREQTLQRQLADAESVRQTAAPDRAALIETKATAKALSDVGGATEDEKVSLAALLQRIERLGREVDDARSVLEEKKDVLVSAKNQRSDADDALTAAKKGLRDKKDKLDAVHKLAFAEDGTWLKRLREKDPAWVQRLGKVINPDLLQRKDLDAQFFGEELDTAFGWSVNLNAIAIPIYAESEEQLLAEHTAHSEAVAIANRLVAERESEFDKANKRHKDASLDVEVAQTALRNATIQKEEANKAYQALNREINDAITDRRNAARKEVLRLTAELASFDDALNERVAAVKARYAEELSELKGGWSLEQSRLEQAVKRHIADLQGLTEDHKKKKQQIKDDFNKACSAKGVDSKTIDDAKQTADAALSMVQAIRDSAGEVNAYLGWLESEWAKRDSYLTALAQLKAKHESALNEQADKERVHSQQKRELDAQKSKALTHLTRLNGQKEQISSIRPRFSYYMLNEPVAPSMPVDLLIREVDSLLDENEKLTGRLVEDIQGINNKIGHYEETQVGQAWKRAKDNLRQQMNISDPFDRKFLINLPQALEVFIDDEVKSIKAARIESLRGIGKGLTDFFERLRVIHNRIKDQSRKITSAIAENMKIDALSSMGITLTSRIESLDYWKSLQDFSKSWQEWRESGADALPNQQFLDDMATLIDTLKSIKSGNHLRDYFDLHIRMVENGHERIINNEHQLDNSTSDGLKYLALCVIFIAISRLLCPDREVLLHWPIDELGILHGENISKLFGMLNHGGIVMVGGFPSEDPVMLRHFKHRQVIDFKKGIRVIDIQASTLKERIAARRNVEAAHDNAL